MSLRKKRGLPRFITPGKWAYKVNLFKAQHRNLEREFKNPLPTDSAAHPTVSFSIRLKESREYPEEDNTIKFLPKRSSYYPLLGKGKREN